MEQYELKFELRRMVQGLSEDLKSCPKESIHIVKALDAQVALQLEMLNLLHSFNIKLAAIDSRIAALEGKVSGKTEVAQESQIKYF